ncbi:MAG TPA: glycosyltransferase family 4 protein [Gammaproteobacteria bacterium]|nr:glycosyltransferase family 4 protein [Gammaproteobacteria bacterium]
MRRYLVLTELFLPTKGGTAVWFSEVYPRLGGKDIHIVTADVPGTAEIDATHPNSVHRVQLARVSWLKPESLIMYLRLFITAWRLTREHRFEAVHAGRALPEGLVAWAVARLARLPCVIYAHGEELTTWGQGTKYKAMRFALRHADRVVANSDYTREVLTRMGIESTRIVLINPGVDIERFRPALPHDDLRRSLGLGDGQWLILSVGRMQKRKGFDHVLAALPALVERGFDVHYALIGIGEHRAELEARARALGVAARTHFLGHVSPEDLPRWYNACNVFAMPNREIDGDTEGFGMVFLEAGACGKPCIAGRAGGTGSAVADNVTGLRVDGTSIPEIAAALARLLSDESLARAMGEAAHARAVMRHSWQYVAEQTEAIKF